MTNINLPTAAKQDAIQTAVTQVNTKVTEVGGKVDALAVKVQEVSSGYKKSVFTASGSFVAPSNVSLVYLSMVGGGGGGGKNLSNTDTGFPGQSSPGIYRLPVAVTPGASYPVTVGQGGAAMTHNGQSGGGIGSASVFRGISSGYGVGAGSPTSVSPTIGGVVFVRESHTMASVTGAYTGTEVRTKAEILSGLLEGDSTPYGRAGNGSGTNSNPQAGGPGVVIIEWGVE